MSKHILLGTGSFAALTIAASFFSTMPAGASPVGTCTVSSGTLPGAPSNSTIDCTGTVTQTTSIADNAAANNVTVILENAASVTSTIAIVPPSPPTTFNLGNNASLTVNNGASLVSSGSLGSTGTAFNAGTNLTAMILSGGSVTGSILGGTGSHVTVAGAVAVGSLGFSSAVGLSGDNNTLTLNPTYGITGSVSGGDPGSTNTTLELGGTGTGTFSATQIGGPAIPTAYFNFAKFLKSGTSVWTLTGAPTQAATPWTITGGSLSIDSDAELGNAASTLTLNGGSLLVTATTAGSRAIVLNGGTITTNTGATYTYSGTFSGTSPLALSGAGTLALTGAETVKGVSGTGNLALAAALTSNQTTDTLFSGVISGAGSLAKSGTGKLTLNGVNTYAGGTTVSAGTLAGTGTIGALTVTTGTVAPGTGTATGKLTTGNLVLNTGATTLINIAPATNSSLAVNGTAAINGTLVANATSGTYAYGTKYAVVTSTGTLSGTYASFSTPGLSAGFRPTLSYDAHDVFLTLAPNALTPLLPAGANRNQIAMAGAIDKAIQGGAVLSPAFSALFNSTGAALGTSLNQLSGEISGDAALAAAQSMTPFVALMTDSDGGNGNLHTASNATSKGLAGVYPAQASSGGMRLWAASYGGYSNFGASHVTGAQPLNTKAFGAVVGVERDFDGVLAGASLAAGQNNFSLSGNQSSGQSTDLMAGLYARARLLDAGYFSIAGAYGSHNIATDRVVTTGATSELRGHFVANDFGGRAEAGWNISLGDGHILTPYAAIAGNSISVPGYSETAQTGASTFALGYSSKKNGLMHSELGARISRDWVMESTRLTAELHGAWAHQFVQDTGTNASFQSLTGSAFTVAGNMIPRETGDVGASLNVGGDSGFHGGARVDGQLGGGFTAVTGMVDFGYRW